MIEDYYLNYIIDPTQRPGEEYSYGERIDWSLQIIMDMLKETPKTNQAVISVYAPDDEVIEYPPCLLFIQFLYFNDKLHIVTNWRSNDISEAFLLNQGSMSLLLRDVAEYAGLHVGTSFYFCSAPHVYMFKVEDTKIK